MLIIIHHKQKKTLNWTLTKRRRVHCCSAFRVRIDLGSGCQIDFGLRDLMFIGYTKGSGSVRASRGWADCRQLIEVHHTPLL